MSVIDLPIADSAQEYREAFLRGIEPEPELSVSEWSERHRILASNSSEPGPYRFARFPMHREIADKMSPADPAQFIVIEKASQMGVSTLCENMVGRIMSNAGGPTFYMLPKEELCKKVSKRRIQPMLDESPVFRGKVTEQKSREPGNNIMEKEFVGGTFELAGAHAASNFRQAAYRNIILDEVDDFEQDVMGEGDPFLLIRRRTASFKRNRKVVILSTPTHEETSNVHRAFLRTDQRYFHVPCPECGTYQVITWSKMTWDDPDDNEIWMECEHCKGRIYEHQKQQLFGSGKWIATAEAKEPNLVGYHISALYAPLGWDPSWADAKHQFLDAKGNEPKMKVFVNQILGEVFKRDGKEINPEVLFARREYYAADCPADVLFLTAGCDVQQSPARLEVEVVGWGNEYESWGVDYRVFHGDPYEDDVWNQFEQLLRHEYSHVNQNDPDARLHIAAAGVDTGYAQERVLEFCRRMGPRCFPVKGDGGWGKPFATVSKTKKTRKNPIPTELYILGVDELKALHFSRLGLLERGAGYCHWPAEHEGFNLKYFQGLTAEKLVPRTHRGVTKYSWEPIRGYNEPLDARNYAFAAGWLMNPDFQGMLRQRSEANDDSADPATRPVERRPRSNFATRYSRRR